MKAYNTIPSNIDSLKMQAKEQKTRELQSFVYKIVDSTNTEAERFARECPGIDALFVADGQTAGSGRLGRSFSSPEGGGLYMTLLIHPERHSHSGVWYTAIAAVCAARAIDALCPVRPMIKWVNDLYVGERKLAGILCKSRSNPEGGLDYLMIGIGVNLKCAQMPDEIRDIVTSIEAAGGGIVDRDKLAVRICDELFAALSDPDGSAIEFYRERSMLTGRLVRVLSPSGDFDAKVLGVTDGGELIIELSCGEKRVLSTGEVSIRPVVES